VFAGCGDGVKFWLTSLSSEGIPQYSAFDAVELSD